MKTKADIVLPIKIGDTLLAGKFKNSRLLVKTITKNEKGEVLINGKQLLKMRILNTDPSMSNMSKFENQLAQAGVAVGKNGVVVTTGAVQAADHKKLEQVFNSSGAGNFLNAVGQILNEHKAGANRPGSSPRSSDERTWSRLVSDFNKLVARAQKLDLDSFSGTGTYSAVVTAKNNQTHYKFYVVVHQKSGQPKIESGWTYKEDAREQLHDNLPPALAAKGKVLTKRGLVQQALNADDDSSWMTSKDSSPHWSRMHG